MSAFVNCNFWNLWLLMKGIIGGNIQTLLNIDVLEQHVLVSIGIFDVIKVFFLTEFTHSWYIYSMRIINAYLHGQEIVLMLINHKVEYGLL